MSGYAAYISGGGSGGIPVVSGSPDAEDFDETGSHYSVYDPGTQTLTITHHQNSTDIDVMIFDEAGVHQLAPYKSIAADKVEVYLGADPLCDPLTLKKYRYVIESIYSILPEAEDFDTGGSADSVYDAPTQILTISHSQASTDVEVMIWDETGIRIFPGYKATDAAHVEVYLGADPDPDPGTLRKYRYHIQRTM